MPNNKLATVQRTSSQEIRLVDDRTFREGSDCPLLGVESLPV